ncbi:MAG: choice-of-anchor tandem repeat GloVer-containing protein [Candidatus Korobacteraceae bacterium]
MANSTLPKTAIFAADLRIAVARAAALLLIALIGFAALPADAQTFQVLHSFAGGRPGADPYSGLTMDRAGNLYGTTAYGGLTGSCFEGLGCGTVFKLTRAGSGWTLNPLYTFLGGNDGAFPEARVILGSDGSLYGTTAGGGGGTCTTVYYSGCGTVFKLIPAATACRGALCPWTETVLYRFTGSADGANPFYGDLVFDHAGNLYGTASIGGVLSCPAGNGKGCGVVFKLTPSSGGWTESVLYSFAGRPDGAFPYSGVIFDSAGNLYGTTYWGGADTNYGTVYELTSSGSAWTETILYSFLDGTVAQNPIGGLIFDGAGNLFGTGSSVYGSVFELTPGSGGWTFDLLYSLPGMGEFLGGPYGSLIMDTVGNLYGTTSNGGVYDHGTVFKLMPPQNDNWIYIPLHEFANGDDGGDPMGAVIQDANGNLYGTAGGGAGGAGVVFEITP